MKDKLKVISSKVYPLNFLHNDLTRITWQRELKLSNPKTDELPLNRLMGQTHQCGKVVRRFIGRGEKPTKPGDTWLFRIEF